MASDRANKILVTLLNEAYKSELHAFRAYLQAAVTVTGPLHDLYEELFKSFMERELHHLYEVGEKITAMGGTPSTECPDIDDLAAAIQKGYDATLAELQKYENTALELYKRIHVAADKLGDLPLVLLIEEIIQEEEEHHDELERILLNGGKPTLELHGQHKVEASKARLDLLHKAGVI